MNKNSFVCAGMFCLILILLFNVGCARERNVVAVLKNVVAIQETNDIQNSVTAQYVSELSYEPVAERQAVQNVCENYGWLTDYGWYVTNKFFDLHEIPRARFRKLDIPLGAVLYQRRLRNEVFNHFYQTDDKSRLIPLYATRFQGIGFDIKFEDNYSRLIMNREGMFWTSGVGSWGRDDPEHPLVGIWGHLPNLFEIRLVEPADYVFYLDIDRRTPNFVMRAGTFLFKQVGDNIFETNSCFSDGHMRLEIINRDLLILTPLYTFPDEEGIVEPVHIIRIPTETP